MYLLSSIILLLLSGPLYAADEPDAEADPASTPTAPIAGEPAVASDEASEQLNAPTVPLERVLPIPSTRRIIETVKHLGLFQREEEVIKFSDEESSISGLYLPENTGRPQGGILILHDIAQHAQWPHSVAPLREYLPDYGWNTLSLFFGDYISKPLPIITQPTPETETEEPDAAESPDSLGDPTIIENTETNTEGELTADTENTEPDLTNENLENNNSDALDAAAENFEAFSVPDTLEDAAQNVTEEIPQDVVFLESMIERVEGGLRQLNTLGQFNLVIIAHGLSANWAVEALRAKFEENPDAIGYSLVLIDAKQSLYPSYKLNDQLAKLKIPILDLYTKNSEDMPRELLARKNAVTRQLPINYMQIGLPSLKTIHSSKHNMISRRVRGWLKTHAAGEVVEVKERGK
jgi:hypothetical protein